MRHPAHTSSRSGSEPVSGSWPEVEPLPEPELGAAAIVNANVAVLDAPESVSVCAPAARLVGITTEAVALPVPSAATVPSVTGVELATIVTVSPGANPVAETVMRWPGTSVALAPIGLPDASVTVTVTPPGVVVVVEAGAVVDVVVVVPDGVEVVVVELGVVDDVVLVEVGVTVVEVEVGVEVVVVEFGVDVLVVDVDDVVEVDLEVVDVELVEVELVDDVELELVDDVELVLVDDVELELVDELEDDVELELEVVGGGPDATVHVTFAGLSEGLVANVIWTFQYLSSWVADGAPLVHAMPTL
jgi:hypothetical protein